MVAPELASIEARVMTLYFVEEVSLPAVSRLPGLDNATGGKAYVVSARRKLKAALRRWTERSKTSARRLPKGAGRNE